MTTGVVADAPDLADLAPRLDRAARELGLALGGGQREQLLRYLALLSQWNRTYNLTAIRDPRDMLVQHLFDCLAVVVPLRRERADHAGRRVLDVGSGAGLPGIVIAVAAPEFEVTCVDSVGKKAAFVAHVAGALGLKNLTSIHGRVESLPASPPFDVVSSRAFSSLDDLVKSTRHLISPDGVWLAMKGKRPDEELAGMPASMTFHVERLSVPDLGAERCIAWIRPIPDSEHTLTVTEPSVS